MTRAEAERECKRLAADDPSRESHQWRPRERGDGTWGIVRIALPPTGPQELQAETQADERPPTPDDPRTAHYRNVGPWTAGG